MGAGSRLPLLRDLVVIHVTDGSPRDLGDARANGLTTRDEYALARRQEVRDALTLAGHDPNCSLGLGCVDQEVTLHLVSIARQVARLIRRFQPEVLALHPYEGGHPDHDAVAFAGHAACRLLEREGEQVPMLVEMTSYHNRAGRIHVGEFLPREGFEPLTLRLTPEEREFRRRLLACYRTQQLMLAQFPADWEQFRLAPRYDFTQPPHSGTLFYELFPWGMTGERFRRLAREAMAELELTGSL